MTTKRLTDIEVARVLGSITCGGINAHGDRPAWKMRQDWLRARESETLLTEALKLSSESDDVCNFFCDSVTDSGDHSCTCGAVDKTIARRDKIRELARRAGVEL